TGARPTVPLLIDERGQYMDSLAIIEWADANGAASPLIEDADATTAWRELLRPGLEAGRARATGRIMRDPEALREGATAASPALFAGMLRPLVVEACRFIGRKYGADLTDEATAEAAMASVLEAVRERLDGRESLHASGFGADDILAATMIQFVQPVGSGFISLKPATRRAWTSEPLADRFSDLVSWRDGLYARHRRPRAAAA
ncbi:MAG: hypothetical protein RIF41_03740, partial [Polyangiaceae bacterium]